MTKISTFCRVCEPSCALIAEVENDEIISLKPDKDHPVTKGFACHKGLATLEIHNDADRLSHPLKKVGDDFVKVSWDDAADDIAAAIAVIKEKYGSDAIASYAGNPLAFNALAAPAIGSFLVKNKIRKNFSSGTQDCTNKFAGSEAIFGSSTIHPIPDIENSDFLLFFGTNPRVSHMSFVSIADPMQALRLAKKRGATIKFVDPRINESVKGIGEIVQVHPDSDVYLMAAMLNHLDSEGKFDETCIRDHTDNIDGLRNFISSYTPALVSDVVGISAGEIKQLADDFAAADSAAIYMSTGVNMGRQGTLAYYLMFMLSVVTGNFDKKGGNYYAEGFYPAAKAGRIHGEEALFFDTEFGEVRRIRGALPGNLMADMILCEDQPIKAMIVISGNPLLSVGNSVKLKKAFEELELLIVIDIYHNASAELAHFVLPATGMYEREDINICGLGMQSQPFIQYTNYIVPPKFDRKPEWWILGRLEQALGFDSVIDNGSNPYLFGRTDHMLKHVDLSIEKLKQLPSQTATLAKGVPGTFYEKWIQTESKRIDCCPDLLREAREYCHVMFNEMLDERQRELAEPLKQLKMISRRTNYMVNSWFHNVKSLKTKSQLNNPLYMHSDDARARNLGEGSKVNISNENGTLVSVIQIDDDLKPGTVAMTHGWGHVNSKMKVAGQFAGVNANELLPSGPGSYEKISNQAFMTGIAVEVACY